MPFIASSVGQNLSIFLIHRCEITISDHIQILTQTDQLLVMAENGILIRKLGLCINGSMVGIDSDPGFGRCEACVLSAGPLHRGAPVVAGVDLDNPEGIVRAEPLFLQNAVVVDAFHISVLRNVGEIRIGHADLFSLVHVGCSPQAVDHRAQHLGGLLPVFSFISETGYHPGLIVIAPEYCVPGMVFRHSGLPVEQNFFQLLEVIGNQHPFLISGEIHLQMMEAEHHGQLLSILGSVTEAVFHGGAGHLAYRDNTLVRAEGLFIQLLQIFVNVGSVSVEAAAVALVIILKASLADQVHHIEAEALYTFFHPEADHCFHLLPYLRVVPVQVGLGYIKQMQIVFIKLGNVFPGAAAELAFPVGGRLSVFFSLSENIVVLISFIPGQCLLKPLVPAGGVVEHHVQHQFDAALLGFGRKPVKVLHSAVAGINVVIVLHIVAVILLRGNEEGSHPDIIRSQLLNIVQFLRNTVQISQSIPVGVIKGFGIDLVYHAFSEIFHNLIRLSAGRPSPREKPAGHD